MEDHRLANLRDGSQGSQGKYELIFINILLNGSKIEIYFQWSICFNAIINYGGKGFEIIYFWFVSIKTVF